MRTRSRIADFAAHELKLTLTPGQRSILAGFEHGRHSQAVWQCGRRGGKSLLADVCALYDAVGRDHLRRHLRPGEPRIAAVVSPRLGQSAAHIANCRALASQSPRLRRLIVSETSDELAFSNGSRIVAYPCSARSIRGGAWSSAILDELAHFVDTESGNAAGDMVLEAALPSLAQFGDEGWLIAISTPRWRQGAFHKLAERARSGRHRAMHYAHLTTAEMNPRISKRWLDDRRREDPQLFAREFLAQFVDGVSSYLASDDVVGCVRQGVGTLPPEPRIRYRAALDVAYSRDRTALGVAHRDLTGTVVVDGVFTWFRAGHSRMLDEVAAVLERYEVRKVRIDQFAETPVREALAERHIVAAYVAWDNASKASAFARLKAATNTGGVELPDDDQLLEELLGLEARPTPSGLTRIAATGGGHDDRAVVVAALVEELAAPRRAGIPLGKEDVLLPRAGRMIEHRFTHHGPGRRAVAAPIGPPVAMGSGKGGQRIHPETGAPLQPLVSFNRATGQLIARDPQTGALLDPVTLKPVGDGDDAEAAASNDRVEQRRRQPGRRRGGDLDGLASQAGDLLGDGLEPRRRGLPGHIARVLP